VVVDSSGQQISAISSMPTVWSYTYEGTDLVADVAYDLFTSSTQGGSNEYEVMIWLAALGGAGPISSTSKASLQVAAPVLTPAGSYGADGKPVAIATVKIAGQTWNLYEGPNGQMTVFSFVATSTVNDFSGDLKEFFDYLVENQSYDDSQYLLSAGAGTEPFTGSDTVFTTSAYSISIE
jgi:xyloglucan-specific endo-beta-1,4-glucanase